MPNALTNHLHLMAMAMQHAYIKTIEIPMADAYSGGCNGCFGKKL
jgi:hypothetical protein